MFNLLWRLNECLVIFGLSSVCRISVNRPFSLTRKGVIEHTMYIACGFGFTLQVSIQKIGKISLTTVQNYNCLVFITQRILGKKLTVKSAINIKLSIKVQTTSKG